MAGRRPSSGQTKSAGRFFKTLFLLAFLAGGGAAWLVLMPYAPETVTLVNIAPGSSTMAIGQKLEAAGVVRSGYAFDLVRVFWRRKLQAGVYRFDHPAPVLEVYAHIVHGDVATVTVTVPEGANLFDIAGRVEQAGLGTRDQFMAAAVSQVSLIADLDPRAASLEGYLFPDTYKFPPNATPAQMVAVMVRRFRVVAAQLGLKQNLHRTVTLASLVERETAVNAERPLVASVLDNRLAKNMPLSTDPSVIYGLELAGKWRGTIYASDLTRETPYNTYLHAGLPPGPVANPGIPSLRAAMNPAKTNYLYFVAAGTDAQGHSLFAETLDEHNRNVAEYRLAQKKAGER
ncbi:MAG: endolytic transglycosylase MltG [Terracidiphilus sp.]